MMAKRKNVLTLFSAFCLGAIGLGVVAATSVEASRLNNFKVASAIDVNDNNVEFEIRNADDKYAYTSSFGEGGLTLNVTAGNYESWRFGLTNWSFPVEDGKNYYCEFVMTANVSGSEGDLVDGGTKGANYSEVVLVCNEDIAEKEAKNWFKRFTADREFIVGQEFVGSGNSSKIHLQLGALRSSADENVFRTTIKKFILKEGGVSGNIVTRVNFEGGNAFADRWKAANANAGFFCTKSNVEEYIYDYCSLYNAQRAIAGAVEDVSDNRTIAESVEYLVNYHGM